MTIEFGDRLGELLDTVGGSLGVQCTHGSRRACMLATHAVRPPPMPHPLNLSPLQVTSLKNLGLNIVRAKLAGAPGREANTFYVTDAVSSEKILRSGQIEEIRMVRARRGGAGTVCKVCARRKGVAQACRAQSRRCFVSLSHVTPTPTSSAQTIIKNMLYYHPVSAQPAPRQQLFA